ncbi:hypothetical protein BDV11DRAFT_210471 [Aspergillus similis]
MLRKRQLLNEETIYSVAKDREGNILHQLTYPEQKSQFFSLLESHSDWIRAIVAYHLNLPVNACRVADSGDWLSGSFNPRNRALVRFPLPYWIGEYFNPGNSNKKV